MATKYINAAKGIRYREHESRMHGKNLDRYWMLAYWHEGKTKSEALGWSSDGWNLKKCEEVLTELKRNKKTGEGASTLTEKRTMEAKAKAAAARAEAEAAKKEQHEQSLTLKAIFDGGYMSIQGGKAQKALDAEKQLMKNHIVPYFDNISLKNITPTLMDDFLQHMQNKISERTKKPLSAATIRYTLAVIRQIWNYALSRNLTDVPYPAQKVKAPQADNKRTRFLSRDEAELLLTTLATRSKNTHDLALLSLFCGLRLGELFKLQWQDVNFKEGFIHVRDRKNKDSGTAWMTPRVKEMLFSRYTGQKGNDVVFPNAEGDNKQLLSKTFMRTVSELGFNHGVDDARGKVVFHTLRHTFASWLAQKSVPLHSLAGLMGHKTTTMTQRYAHLAPDVQKSHAMLIDDTPQQGNVIPFKAAENA